MNILITGGCGFIGHHAVEHILKNTDWNIIVIDSLTYAGNTSRLTDIECYDKSRVKIIWHDMRAPFNDNLIKRIGGVNYIVNYASNSHVDRSIENPVDFINSNVSLMLNMLEYVRKVQPQKFVHISTDEVYGPANEGCNFEEWATHIPSNPYAASKSSQESIAIAYWRTYGIPLIITNTMNNFGERQHPEKFIPKVIRALKNNEVIKLHARKEIVKYKTVINKKYIYDFKPTDFFDVKWTPSKRMWLHARNHADAILFLLKNISPNKYPDFNIPTKYNIAGEIELDNEEVMRRIAVVMGFSNPKYEYVDYHSCRPGHDFRYALDGSLLKEAGWKQPMNFDECLEKTIKWELVNNI